MRNYGCCKAMCAFINIEIEILKERGKRRSPNSYA